MSEKVRIDRERVRHVAKLASLSLSDAEADALARDLETIVRYVEEIDTLDTSNVPPTASPTFREHATAWREDEVGPCLSREEALARAPRVEHDGFAVPPFVES